MEAPATPHGTTILLPAVPTWRATEHRLASSQLENSQKPLPIPPNSSNPPPSDETQIEPFWAIPYTSYVSKKGSKPVVLAGRAFEIHSSLQKLPSVLDSLYGSYFRDTG